MMRWPWILVCLLALALPALFPVRASAEDAGLLDRLRQTVRIEIRIPVLGGDWEKVPAYEIRSRQEVKRILDALRLEPTGVAAGWKWPNRLAFVLSDGSAIQASIGGAPELIGIDLPGGKSADFRLPDEFRDVIGPCLQRAVEYFEESCGKGQAMSGANGQHARGPSPQPGEAVHGLKVTLAAASTRVKTDQDLQLSSVFENVGTTRLPLTFWWNRRLRVTDAAGNVVAPGPGPVLPCGVAETAVPLEPGKSLERKEHFGCTQPAGCDRTVGWSYHLAPGTYRIVLIYESPMPHGYDHNPDPGAWIGKVLSNEITVKIGE